MDSSLSASDLPACSDRARELGLRELGSEPRNSDAPQHNTRDRVRLPHFCCFSADADNPYFRGV